MSEEIQFSIEESPPWRSSQDAKSSSEMLMDIVRWMKESSPVGEILPQEKSYPLFIDFVHQSNLGEDVGTQTREETTELLEPLLRKKESSTPLQRERCETVNSYKALTTIAELSNEMEGTGMITVQQITDIHRILMAGLHHKYGEIRDTNVHTVTPDGERYNYPSHELVEDKLYNVIDRHNIHMKELQESTLSTYDKLVFLIKAAAWLLFNFVDTHPFTDGNGRMCRLLAGYTMMVITPFPIHPYYVQQDTQSSSSSSSREDYINAIVSCRRHSNQEPLLVAALLVDGLYHSWQTYLGN